MNSSFTCSAGLTDPAGLACLAGYAYLSCLTGLANPAYLAGIASLACFTCLANHACLVYLTGLAYPACLAGLASLTCLASAYSFYRETYERETGKPGFFKYLIHNDLPRVLPQKTTVGIRGLR